MTERETELIKRAQKGDTRAFSDLVAAYDSQVMNLAISIVGRGEDAADVYQEIFIKVFKALKNFRFQSEFKTWLYRITVNTCYTMIRKRQRSRDVVPTGIEENPDYYLNQPDDDIDDTDSDLMRGEMSEVLRQAVEELPPKQRAVVALRHYHDKKIREIAEIMKINEGTVKGYLFRAVKTLKSKVEPYYLGDTGSGL